MCLYVNIVEYYTFAIRINLYGFFMLKAYCFDALMNYKLYVGSILLVYRVKILKILKIFLIKAEYLIFTDSIEYD